MIVEGILSSYALSDGLTVSGHFTSRSGWSVGDGGLTASRPAAAAGREGLVELFALALERLAAEGAASARLQLSVVVRIDLRHTWYTD